MRRITAVMLMLAVLWSNTALIEAADADQIAGLIDNLLGSNYMVSTQASKDLAALGSEVIPDIAEKVLSHPSWINRMKGVTVLKDMGAVEGIPYLMRVLSDENQSVRDAARNALTAIHTAKGEQAEAVLAELLVAEETTIRNTAKQMLTGAGWAETDIQEKIAAALADTDPARRRVALDLLSMANFKKRTLFDQVASLINDPDLAVQKQAVKSLSILGFTPEEIYRELQARLLTEVTNDWAVLADLFAQMVQSDQKAALVLMGIISNRNQDFALRKAAYDGLAKAVPQLEYHLDRGLVAVKVDSGVYLSWRLLGTEPYDLGFNVYRDGVKVNADPVKTSTNYLDPEGTLTSEYYVAAVRDGVEVEQSATAKVLPEAYIAIPLDPPAGGRTPDNVAYSYTANDASAADLDGDGQYEIILKWDPTNSKDNSQSGYTGNVYLDAYKLDGTRMWRIDLGRNIRAGAHYTQFIVYDFDGDGKAELAVKTADGTVDGLGNVLGDPNADYRNSSGYILTGPEYLTMFDGVTGKALATIDYVPPRGNVAAWGDNYGNRVDRFLAGVAYLDGVRPSLIMARGYYTRAVIAAYNWVDNQFVPVWIFDSNDPGKQMAAGQGNHQLSIADVDGDGRDEIIYGAVTIDDDGTVMYATGLGHGDAMHVTDIDPSRPGLEVFAVHESVPNPAGIELHDARTGEILWGVATDYDVGRGISVNIDPNHYGNEAWASRSPLYNAKGEVISNSTPNSINHAIWWDGDLLRELLDHTSGMGKIDKWDWENKTTVNLITFIQSASNNGTKGNPSLTADILGDWREEAVFRTSNNRELRIYLTTYPTEHRLYTFMHDRQYRVAVAWQNVAYNQPPHPSFYVGEDMEVQDFNIGLAFKVLEEYRGELGK